VTSCAIIGFFTTWTFSAVNLLFFVLTVYFVLTVRYGMKERQVQQYIEPYGYVFAIGLLLAICIAALVTEAFNPMRFMPTCLMRPYPTNCYDNDNNDDDTPCLRGGQARPVFYFFKACALVAMLLGIAGTWLVYWTVRQQHWRQRRYSWVEKSQSMDGQGRRRRRWRPPLPPPDSHQKRLRTVTRQAYWYTAVFMNGMLASLLSSRLEAAVAAGVVATTVGDPTDDERLANNIVLTVFVSLYLFLCPLQGLLNVVIYLRPSFIVWRELYPCRSRLWALRQIIRGKRPILTRRVRHLVDGNVNEESKYGDSNNGITDTTPPTLRMGDLFERAASSQCSNSSRKEEGPIRQCDKDDDDEAPPVWSDHDDDNAAAADDDASSPRPGANTNIATNDRQQQQQQQQQPERPGIAIVVAVATVSDVVVVQSDEEPPSRKEVALRVSFADDHDADDGATQNPPPPLQCPGHHDDEPTSCDGSDHS
jgi:hypothetical protein